MECAAGDKPEGPFQRHHEETKQQVDELQDRYRFDGTVEGLGEEIPEDLGPKEAFYGGSYLIDCCGEDDEASPVVLDKFAHLELSSWYI